jgi:hypothetical protein
VLVAVDHDGRFHVRTTESVTHDDTRGEAIYSGKPLASGASLPAALRAALAVRRTSPAPAPRG